VIWWRLSPYRRIARQRLSTKWTQKKTGLVGEKFSLIDPRSWREISTEMAPQVTTRHLFWPNQRRKAALLLPTWLRNLDVLVRIRQLPPRGAVSHADAAGGLDPKWHTEFYA